MEDSFRVRVDRVFGSLTPTSSSTSSLQPTISSLWSLTDDEIRKDTWTREPVSLSNPEKPKFGDDSDDEERSFPSDADRLLSTLSKGGDEQPKQNPNSGVGDLRKEMEDDLQGLDVDSDEGEGHAEQGCSKDVVVEGDDELDVRNSIGLDSTLDFEEEEDAYDKVAVGREQAGDRMYMSDVNDYMPDCYPYGGVLDTYKEASRDPRANRLAAKLRLQQDAEAARSFNDLQVSKKTKGFASDTPNTTSENENNIKSILKRKEDQMGCRSQKRVRFDSTCKPSGDEPDGDEKSIHKESSSMVPDYIRNPSKYTHYTFDSATDMNEESNCQAYTDFITMVKKSKQSEPEEEEPADISKPVIFNPKKKTRDVVKEVSMERKSLPVSFALGGMNEDEAREMEVDEEVTEMEKTVKGGGERTARHYRSRQSLDS